jgi:hypothetical protein
VCVEADEAQSQGRPPHPPNWGLILIES